MRAAMGRAPGASWSSLAHRLVVAAVLSAATGASALCIGAPTSSPHDGEPVRIDYTSALTGSHNPGWKRIAHQPPMADPSKGPRQHASASHADLRSPEVDRRTRQVLTGGVLAVAAYGAATWWSEGLSGRFQTVDEGWFGQNTGDGGADKLGHLHANYVGTRLLARAFEWAGNEPDRALSLAAWSTLGTFLSVEVLDAFTPRYRFSREDAIMNAVGVGLGVLMEKNPRLDAMLDLRLLYQPSNDARLRNNFDPFGDYSGQTYLLVGKASGLPTLRARPFLRYFELTIGYGTRGYEVGPDLPSDRSRNVYIGISLNLSELLSRTAFSGRYRDGRAHRATRGFLEVFQLPGTAALASHKL